MRIFELRYPGTWPSGMDVAKTHQAQGILTLLENHLADAALALELFESAQRTMGQTSTLEERQRLHDEATAIERELELKIPSTLSPEDRWKAREEVRERADTEARRRAWAAGLVPASYKYRLPFIHAHTVLYALDGISKALGKLAALPGVPHAVVTALATFDAKLPAVKGVRDSAHHVEDRVRGKQRGEKAIALRAVDTPEIHAPSGALILNSLLGNRLSYTAADGSLKEVAIEHETVEMARDAIQNVLDAFFLGGPGAERA